MKKLVGQRENVNPGLKDAIALVEMFTPLGPKPRAIKISNTYCGACGIPVEVIISEDDKGKIWYEGPDTCIKCGHQLSDDKATVQPLSQEAINNLFGKY